MLRSSAYLSLTIVAIAIGVTPRADARPEPVAAVPAAPETIKVGIMGGMFRGVPEGLVKAGGQQFGGLFQKITTLPGEVEVEENHLVLTKKLNDNKVQLGVYHGFEWAWVQKDNPKLAPLVITVTTHAPQACVVVPANSPAMNAAGLKGANVEIPYNMKAHGYLYIDKLAKENPDAFKPTLPEDLGPHEALDNLVQGKSTAALVDKATLAAYQANNPGKSAKIKVLCQSDPLPQTVLVYNKESLPKKTVSQLQNGLLNADKNPQSKTFLFLWNLRGFEEATPAFDDLLSKSVKAFPPPKGK